MGTAVTVTILICAGSCRRHRLHALLENLFNEGWSWLTTEKQQRGCLQTRGETCSLWSRKWNFDRTWVKLAQCEYSIIAGRVEPVKGELAW